MVVLVVLNKECEEYNYGRYLIKDSGRDFIYVQISLIVIVLIEIALEFLATAKINRISILH